MKRSPNPAAPIEFEGNEEIIIESISNGLSNFAHGDMVKSLQLRLPLATFTLCVCLIDVLANHRYYRVPGFDKQHKRFITFIEEYFPDRYKGMGRDIYIHLRSKLVHNYSASKKYTLLEGVPWLHFKPNETGGIFLVAESFINDIQAAFYRYQWELRFDLKIAQIAINHHNEFPIFTMKEIVLAIPENKKPAE